MSESINLDKLIEILSMQVLHFIIEAKISFKESTSRGPIISLYFFF